MLVIRMQRTGRKGHAQFRVVVQDSRRTPTSGRVVAFLGNFNPHNKEAKLDKEKAAFYLEHGAQPSDRVARLLKTEGVKLPTWVKQGAAKKGDTRNPEKLRKNQPASTEASVSAKATTDKTEDEAADKPAEEASAEEALVVEEAATEADTEEKSAEAENVVADKKDEEPKKK